MVTETSKPNRKWREQKAHRRPVVAREVWISVGENSKKAEEEEEEEAEEEESEVEVSVKEESKKEAQEQEEEEESETNPSEMEVLIEEWKKEAEESESSGSDFSEMESESDIREMGLVPIEEWKEAAQEFDTHFSEMEMKIHRFPAGLQGLGGIAPRFVAIGPYYRSKDYPQLQVMEGLKQVAAYHLVGDSYHEMHSAVSSVASEARNLYADYIATQGIGAAEFALMMLRDGCFLLQYMLMCTAPDEVSNRPLLRFLKCNQACISNDIMLLENQIPWLVIETLRKFRSVPVEDFIAKMGRTLQIRGESERKSFVWDKTRYTPPHLLGLLRLYKVGIIGSTTSTGRAGEPLLQRDGVCRSMSKTISAMELAEIGIKLEASKTTKFTGMGIKRGRPLLGHAFLLPPLLLDDIRSVWLINMAAFEVCVGMATGDSQNDLENPVVCSYLAVLAMLMDREEDVHELRSKRLVQGELTNKETLAFFKSLIKHISGGPLYIHIMEEIEDYKIKRWMWIKVHVFFYKNLKTIITVLSIIGVLAGIFKTLLSLKKQ